MKYFFFLVRLLSDTQFISRCVCSFFLPQRSRQEVIYSPQLFNHPTDTTGVTVRGAERMPPGEEPPRILHPFTCPEGCEPQVLGVGESSCNILFVCRISKLPATWEGNNRVQTTCFCPLSFLTHEHPSHQSTDPPRHTQSPSLLLLWRMCGGTKGEGGVTLMTSAERGWSPGHSSLFLRAEIIPHTQRQL